MHPDLFDETIDKKILRMEKWIVRLQKELWFLKNVNEMRRQMKTLENKSPQVEQLDIFAS